jgi:dUTP pyrophosphatase
MELTIETEHKQLYHNHQSAYVGDAGVDLFFVRDHYIPEKSTVLIDLEIACQLKLQEDFLSYFLYPRSSIYKTPLIMANSVGIIDSMYRDNIKVAVYNLSDKPYIVKAGQRLFQICNAQLAPMAVKLGKVSISTRGEGFGSSGV